MPKTTFIILTEDEFDARFPLVPNHIAPNAPFNDCMFETYGAELDFVRRQPPGRIWTVIDADGAMAIASGYHRVNRLGYLISTVPVSEAHEYEVVLEDLNDDEEEAIA